VLVVYPCKSFGDISFLVIQKKLRDKRRKICFKGPMKPIAKIPLYS
jgi:hypothetical protein